MKLLLALAAGAVGYCYYRGCEATRAVAGPALRRKSSRAGKAKAATCPPSPRPRPLPTPARSRPDGRRRHPALSAAKSASRSRRRGSAHLASRARALRRARPHQGALARYYESVAEWMLPEIRDRPLSLVRCPQGPGEGCFYQKNIDDKFSPRDRARAGRARRRRHLRRGEFGRGGGRAWCRWA